MLKIQDLIQIFKWHDQPLQKCCKNSQTTFCSDRSDKLAHMYRLSQYVYHGGNFHI